MSQVIVLDRNGNIRLQMEYFEEDRLIDIKQRLCKNDPESMYISYKGKLLSDTTCIRVLGERVVLLLENDIEFTSIGDGSFSKLEAALACPAPRRADVVAEACAEPRSPPRAKAGEDSKPSNTFFLNGKKYLITQRRKKFNLRHIKEALRRCATREVALQLLLFAFLMATQNFFLLLALVFIKCLSFCDYLFSSRRIWSHISNQHVKTVFMFVASLLFIDHSTYYNE